MCSLVFMWFLSDSDRGYSKSCCLYAGYVLLARLPSQASVGKEARSLIETWNLRDEDYPGGPPPIQRKRTWDGIRPLHRPCCPAPSVISTSWMEDFELMMLKRSQSRLTGSLCMSVLGKVVPSHSWKTTSIPCDCMRVCLSCQGPGVSFPSEERCYLHERLVRMEGRTCLHKTSGGEWNGGEHQENQVWELRAGSRTGLIRQG